jgi:hypothetical protein
LGEQAVLNKEIYYNADADDDKVFGYQERHAEYRYKSSSIHGNDPDSNADGMAITSTLTGSVHTTVNALREAIAVQRMLERDARGGTRYISISFHYSTCLSSIFSISFHYFLLYFPYLFTIRLAFLRKL